MNFKDIMENNQEAFEGMEGIDETFETVTSKMKELGYNVMIDNQKEPSYIPKDRFNEVIAQKNELKTQTGELSGQLEELKKAAKGNEELTKQIEELQGKNEEWEEKYKHSQLNNAIKVAALKHKANDASDIAALIDKSALEMQEDGTIKGLDEQLTDLAENKPYLFEQEKKQQPKGANPPGASNTSKSYQEKYNDLQQQLRNNPNDQGLLKQLFMLKEQKK